MAEPSSIAHLCILDPSLRDLRGHHYEYNRCVMTEARRRGIQVSLYAHRDVLPEIQAELGAIPHFSRDIYTATLPPTWPAKGKLARWLEPVVCNRLFARDLARLPHWPANTMVFAHTIQHRQAWALARWQRRIGVRLSLLLRYATDAQARWYSATDAYYRTALRHLDYRRAKLSTDTERLAAAYQRLAGQPVQVLPIPHVPDTPAIPRTPSAPYRVLQIGHTSSNKGMGLLAQFTNELSRLPLQVRLQVSSHPFGDETFLRVSLPALQACPSITQLNGNLDTTAYYRELREADVVLNVYNPVVYGGASSGVFAEAVALEKPLITSPHTWMADEIQAGRAAGIVLSDYSAPAFLEGLNRYVGAAPQLALAAQQHGATWRRFHGATHFCDCLLAPWASTNS